MFSSYYIRQNQGFDQMKPKKKTSNVNKKGAKKIIPSKPIMLIDKTIITTKQKTNTTIQDHFQNNQVRKSLRINKTYTPRLSCVQKLQECNLSPFSSPDTKSISPRYRKTISPSLKHEKEKKNNKSKPFLPVEKTSQKKKVEVPKREIKNKPKMTKQQSNQYAYENLLIRRLNQKKITQLSEQSSVSITKRTKMNLKIKPLKQTGINFNNKCSNYLIMKQMKFKIKDKYRKQFPGLKDQQLKFYCSIVLFQRLWRQTRIKNIISQFISPRAPIENNISLESHREDHFLKSGMTAITQEHTSELIKKYHIFSKSLQKKKIVENQAHSTQLNTGQKCSSKLNLKELQLSSCELSSDKEIKYINFVQCLRDINFHKPNKKVMKKQKMNVFNLRESLSQKCLMQTFYQKLFKDSPLKRNNFQIFSSKKQQKNLERSIELINTMRTPQKVELIEVEQRFQTESQETTSKYNQKNSVITHQIAIQTQQFFIQKKSDSQQINTLKQLNNVSQGLIMMLLMQFTQEFHSFTAKSILKKKKKAQLPGIHISSSSIRQYLTGLTSYMFQIYQIDVVRRFFSANPISFLKIHHDYDEDEQQMQMQQDDQINIPIIPNALFYDYQLIYESEKVKIPEKDMKYSNFLEGLIKINNLLLANCLSQFLQRKRIDRVILPWDNKFQPDRVKIQKKSKKNLQKELNGIIDFICDAAFMKVGQFHKSLHDSYQQQKLLRSINQQYKTQGNDWNGQYQYLELRLQITNYVQQNILNQILNELTTFF